MKISDVMHEDVAKVNPHATLRDAARLMRERNIGDVVVTEGSEPLGIITDRDIAIRGVAEGLDPEVTEVGDIASERLKMLSAQDSLEDAAALMRDGAVRRVPVVDDGSLVGIVSLGDIELAIDRKSVLAGVSSAPANH